MSGKGEKPSGFRNLIDFLWTTDATIGTVAFEVVDFIRRSWLAYAAWLEKFRVRGFKRLVVDLLDDAATFGTA